MTHTSSNFFKGNGLQSFINGDNVCPEQFLPHAATGVSSSSGSALRKINASFTSWIKIDQLLLSWMMSSIQ